MTTINAIKKLTTEFKARVKARDEAKVKFNRLLIAQCAGASDSSFEAVGRAACEFKFCEMEMEDAHKDLLKAQK